MEGQICLRIDVTNQSVTTPEAQNWLESTLPLKAFKQRVDGIVCMHLKDHSACCVNDGEERKSLASGSPVREADALRHAGNDEFLNHNSGEGAGEERRDSRNT